MEAGTDHREIAWREDFFIIIPYYIFITIMVQKRTMKKENIYFT